MSTVKEDEELANGAEEPATVSPTTRTRRTRSRSNADDLIAFPPSSATASVTHQHMFTAGHPPRDGELMGPILRRKKVVSMPLGAGGDFFATPDDFVGPHRQLLDQGRVKVPSYDPNRPSAASLTPPESPGATPRRTKQDSFMKGVMRRKQISLDLLGPNDFFATPAEEEEAVVLPPDIKEEEEGEKVGDAVPTIGEDAVLTVEKQLFRPLRFAPRVIPKMGRGGGHGGGHGGGGGLTTHSAPAALPTIDEDTKEAFQRYSMNNQEVKLQLLSLRKKLESESSLSEREELLTASQHALDTYEKAKADEKLLQSKLFEDAAASKEAATSRPVAGDKLIKDDDTGVDEEEDEEEDEFDASIIRAGRRDKIKAGILFVIMLALTLVVTLWKTHPSEMFLYVPIGLACVTPCTGNLETQDFFHGHNEFEENEVIQLVINIDGNEYAHENKSGLLVQVVGEESHEVKANYTFHPIEAHHRITEKHNIKVDFPDPHEPHIIVVNSTEPDIAVSFTLAAEVKTPLANYSVLVAALIMVVVYFFILIEVIHRTLVAIFGSMVALMFFFIMEGGNVETIRQLMLNLEWSTLGLLFGMMLIVGELSHTGVFEYCAVRLLMASKGSFNRLLVLLCVLTAVASAFLDNVTTMLLVAPVTIDMCNILDVDPRPYLISEVLLSNIGGTATLIGDPPNIIIGSAFQEEIGFVDFITNGLPCIFLLCIPVSLVLVLWIYRFYLTSSKMRVLDTAKLKKTYPIYDEPRLMIAGTVTFFVILMFFLHPVHHKDTAWIALLGAFVTISFTNPHDVQDALRNHVEWDTLLFFAGLFVLVEVCAAMGLLSAIGEALATYIASQPEESQLAIAITLIIWVSAITSAFLDNIPYTATMIPVVAILAEELETLDLATLAWALSFGACLGGNGTLLGASANIVTAGISTNKGFEISFLNFLYPGMLTMVATVVLSNIYMLVRYVWAA